MKIEDKRKVIEVLLCASNRNAYPAFGQGRQLFGESVGVSAELHWRGVPIASRGSSYEEDAIEAAYRLIETSATLRREWFGSTSSVEIGASE